MGEKTEYKKSRETVPLNQANKKPMFNWPFFSYYLDSLLEEQSTASPSIPRCVSLILRGVGIIMQFCRFLFSTFFYFMTRYPMVPSFPHKIVYFESKSTVNHHPETRKTKVILLVADWRGYSVLYRRMPRTILKLAS